VNETKLLERGIELANRELSVSIAEAAIRFFDQVAGGIIHGELKLPIAGPFALFQAAVQKAYAERRGKLQ
jgi:hypothetical protein